MYLLYWHLKFTNIEIGSLASLDRRDQCLISLAEAKHAVAKAEYALAHCRVQEIMELHRLQCIREELAQKRIAQAEINVRRAKSFIEQTFEAPRSVGSLQDILTTLLSSSLRNSDDIGHS